MQRILPVSSICATLWANEAFRMAAPLAGVFVDQLNAKGLFEIAAAPRDAAGEAGGESDRDADNHLARRFTNSVGRNLCAALDPFEKLGAASNLLIGPMLGERILIVDIPCGAGAAGLGLLSCVSELRGAGSLPTLPLRIQIIAGDLSARATSHFRELFDAFAPTLHASAITAELIERNWDVSDVRGNAEFVDQIVGLAASNQQVIVVVSNFSDAMADQALLEHFNHFLSQLIGRLAPWPTTVCWIEPKSNKAAKYLPRLMGLVGKFFTWLAPAASTHECAFKMLDPVTNTEFDSAISILKCSSSTPE